MKIYQFDEFIFKLGNNAQENNQLLDEATQNNIWFHLENNPSPHGILFVQDIPNKNILLQCATEIKNNSKQKNDKNTKIMFTQRKFVKKTNILGTVIVSKKKIIKV